jgi:multiple sugar transport system ATP-binding protein
MAMVFQRDALLPHLTARENIALGMKLRGHTRDEVNTRVREAVECFRLQNVLDRLPRALSGGERQRTALARAIVRRPQALLLDEPLSSVDPPLRAELRRDILEFHRRLGCTVVLVTHDQEEALAMGDRVGVLNNGRLQQVAEPPALYSQPATAFVAGFVGSPPMNLFRGSLALEGGSLWFHGPEESSLSLCLTDAHRKCFAGVPKGQIIVGLRAEHIVDALEGMSLPYGSEAEALVEAVEYLGADALVRWTCGSTRFTTRSPSSRIPSPSTRSRLVFDMSQACFFDAVTGCRLKAEPAA